MTDLLEFFGELRQVRARMEAIEHTQDLLVRAHGEIIEQLIWDRLDQDDVLADVYLLVDGKRSQKDIARLLEDAEGAVGNREATVSRKLFILFRDMDLLELIEHSVAGKVYRRTPVDRILGISRKLQKRREKAKSAKRT